LADRVPLTIVYLLVRRVLSLAVLLARRDLDKNAELLVLRHENAVLRRHAGRIRYEPADRIWFAALAQLIPRVRWAPRPCPDPRRTASARHLDRIPGSLQRRPAAPGHRPARPRCRMRRSPVRHDRPDIERIRRKPVLSGLINEYMHAA